METKIDVIVIGGGQAGLSCGYYLNKAKIDYLILDKQSNPGGNWNNVWDSLHLFSPAEHSSLPGYIMPKDNEEYPRKDHVLKYLHNYEKRYNLNVKRDVNVQSVNFENNEFILNTNKGIFKSNFLISSTGTQDNPYIPDYTGIDKFNGIQIHSQDYRNPNQFSGKRVAVIGAANSAVQIVADLIEKAEVFWICKDEPHFLPPEVDGRYLFELATKKYKGESIVEGANLGNIVQVPSVKSALNKGLLNYYRIFSEIDENGLIWEDGSRLDIDSIIWATGFKSSLSHLDELEIQKSGRIKTNNTHSLDNKNLWLVGYGNWTGFASATMIGVGRSAKKTVEEISQELNKY